MFGFEYWRAIYHELKDQYEDVTSILSDKDAIVTHIEKTFTNVIMGDGGPTRVQHYDALTSDVKEEFHDIAWMRYTNALATYRDQLVVLVYSYVEAMIKDYFTALFMAHPVRMSKYLRESGEDAVKLFVKIVNSPGKDEFIEYVARVAAGIATADGKNPQVLMQRIAEAGKADSATGLHKSLAQDLSMLKECRNRLVHEPNSVLGWNHRVTRGEAEDEIQPEQALEIYLRLAVYLQNLCLDNFVPIFDHEPTLRAVYLNPEEADRMLQRLMFGDSSISETPSK